MQNGYQLYKNTMYHFYLIFTNRQEIIFMYLYKNTIYYFYLIVKNTIYYFYLKHWVNPTAPWGELDNASVEKSWIPQLV